MTLGQFNKAFTEAILALNAKPSMNDADFNFVPDGGGGFKCAEFVTFLDEALFLIIYPDGRLLLQGLTATPALIADLAETTKTLQEAWREYRETNKENI